MDKKEQSELEKKASDLRAKREYLGKKMRGLKEEAVKLNAELLEVEAKIRSRQQPRERGARGATPQVILPKKK